MASNNSILKDRTAAAQSSIQGRNYAEIGGQPKVVHDDKRMKEIEVINRVKQLINSQFRERILSESKDPQFVNILSTSIESLLEKEKSIETVIERKNLRIWTITRIT